MRAGFNTLANSFKFKTLMPCTRATLLRLKSLVISFHCFSKANRINLESTSCRSSKSSSTISIDTSFASCISFKISNPRRPRFRFIASAESEIICNSFKTKTGTTNGPSINPVAHSSLIRPSIITEVSNNFAVEFESLDL